MDTFSLMLQVLYVQILFRNPTGSGVLEAGRATGAKNHCAGTKHALLANATEGYWIRWTYDMTQGHITAMSHFGATWHGSLYSAGRLYASLLNETLLRQEFPVQI